MYCSDIHLNIYTRYLPSLDFCVSIVIHSYSNQRLLIPLQFYYIKLLQQLTLSVNWWYPQIGRILGTLSDDLSENCKGISTEGVPTTLAWLATNFSIPDLIRRKIFALIITLLQSLPFPGFNKRRSEKNLKATKFEKEAVQQWPKDNANNIAQFQNYFMFLLHIWLLSTLL